MAQRRRRDQLFRDQFMYCDPVTGLTYLVVYDFDLEVDKADVVFALLPLALHCARKVRLTRDLRQRMTAAAFEDWLAGFDEEAVETVPVPDCAFNC